MPDITFPGFFSFAAGDTSDAEDVEDLFFNDTSPTTSLSIVNGYLDADNFASTFDLEDVHTQRGSIVNFMSASGNANLDWKPQLFGGKTFNTGSGEQYRIPTMSGESKMYIPGANKTFYLPVQSYLSIHWNIFWNAQIPDHSLSVVYFHVDGDPQRQCSRNVSYTSPVVGTETERYARNRGHAKARAYSGHWTSSFLAPIAAGWHTAGLAVVAEPDVILTRTHACDIQVLAFKV